MTFYSAKHKGPPPGLDFTQWMEIYISPRPLYSPRLASDVDERISRLSLDPAAPFRLGLPMLSSLSHKYNYKIEYSSQIPAWDGSPRGLLSFKGTTHEDFVVTLGRCTCSQDTGRKNGTPSSERGVLGPHFVTAQEGSYSILEMLPHNCKSDHVQAGITRRWEFQVNSTLNEHPQVLQVSLTRSHFESGSTGNMLEVHLDFVEVSPR